MMRPLVKKTSSRICVSTSQPAFSTAGVMYFVHMSRSLKVFLSIPRSSPRQVLLTAETESGYDNWEPRTIWRCGMGKQIDYILQRGIVRTGQGFVAPNQCAEPAENQYLAKPLDAS